MEQISILYHITKQEDEKIGRIGHILQDKNGINVINDSSPKKLYAQVIDANTQDSSLLSLHA